ncbi:MAG: hypothetical protein HYZ29_36205, partial [Myxococcales bacterium]|nr:hypothetical protein [Myxococcales bacterium]
GGLAGAGGGGTGGGGAVGGGGSGGGGGESCDPYAPRSPATDVFIGPTGFEKFVVGHVESAQKSVHLMIYQFTNWAIRDALIAAKKKGLDVKVIYDGKQAANTNTVSALQNAGVEVKAAPAKFDHAHAKVLIVDGKRGVVMMGNFNSYSMSSERNYNAVVESADDVADLEAVFQADWGGTAPNLSCTRLVVSPENSRARLTELINKADQRLDLSVMYVTDDKIVAAVKARVQAGVKVRMLLANPAWISNNAQTAATFKALGVPVKYYVAGDLHAKLLITEDAAFVGSENFSYTSLDKNREAGVFVTESAPVAKIQTQFDADFAAGATP